MRTNCEATTDTLELLMRAAAPPRADVPLARLREKMAPAMNAFGLPNTRKPPPSPCAIRENGGSG